jgi:hypothetical protein
MRAYLKAYRSQSYWRYCFSLTRAITALLAAFGALWGAAEMTAFFSSQAANTIRARWDVFLIAGIIWALWNTRPSHRFSCKLNNRDVVIEIAVADLFAREGALIIGTNTSFDTAFASELISEHSVQGQFTNRYYDSVAHLDQDLTEQLRTLPAHEAPTRKPGKRLVYDVGTVARLTTRGKHVYLVAVATFNEHGRTRASFYDLQTSLAKLWDFIAERGAIEPLVMPVIGSRFARTNKSREEIIREIVKSFAVACATKQFCSKLTIVIPPSDFYDFQMNLTELSGYVRHVAQYTEYREAHEIGTGSPVNVDGDSSPRIFFGDTPPANAKDGDVWIK